MFKKREIDRHLSMPRTAWRRPPARRTISWWKWS